MVLGALVGVGIRGDDEVGKVGQVGRQCLRGCRSLD